MKVGIFGCGAYGMALSSILVENKHEVTMWTRFEEEKINLETNRCNEKKLANFKLDDSIKITTSLEELIKGKDLLIIAIPAAYVDDLAKDIAPFIKNNHILIATKGIEQDTGLFINQILKKYIKTKNIAVISGPSFAVDLITKMPAGLSLASKSNKTMKICRDALANNYIKVAETKDIIGTEICGSIKNVIALSAGMLEGLGANDSTTAMLLTEATKDMMEIMRAFRANKKTVISFAGLGDLLLTCTSVKSRNFRFGKLVGSGATKEEINDFLKETTVEGYYTLESIYKLLQDKKVSMPIIDLIYDIVINDTNPKELLTFLVEKG